MIKNEKLDSKLLVGTYRFHRWRHFSAENIPFEIRKNRFKSSI